MRAPSSRTSLVSAGAPGGQERKVALVGGASPWGGHPRIWGNVCMQGAPVPGAGDAGVCEEPGYSGESGIEGASVLRGGSLVWGFGVPTASVGSAALPLQVPRAWSSRSCWPGTARLDPSLWRGHSPSGCAAPACATTCCGGTPCPLTCG